MEAAARLEAVAQLDHDPAGLVGRHHLWQLQPESSSGGGVAASGGRTSRLVPTSGRFAAEEELARPWEDRRAHPGAVGTFVLS